MTRTVILILALGLMVMTAKADQAGPPKLHAGLEEFRARLALTAEQETQLRSVFEAHVEAQLKTLDAHGIDAGVRGDAAPMELQELRALRDALRANSASTERRLAGVLTAAQMTAFRNIRAEQEERLRERLLSRRVDEIIAMLNLGAETGDLVKPILQEHFKAQLAILDKHGIAPGRRIGLRKLRALRKDMRQNDDKTGERLSEILSKAQREAYEALQAEQRQEMRSRLFQN